MVAQNIPCKNHPTSLDLCPDLVHGFQLAVCIIKPWGKGLSSPFHLWDNPAWSPPRPPPPPPEITAIDANGRYNFRILGAYTEEYGGILYVLVWGPAPQIMGYADQRYI